MRTNNEDWINETTDRDLLLKILVTPNAKDTSIAGIYDGQLKVTIKEAPEKDKANRSLIHLLSRTLHISKSCIEIIDGHTNRRKKLLIRSLGKQDCILRLLNQNNE